MAKLWQYSLVVIVFLLIMACFLWATIGHQLQLQPQICNNTQSRDSHPLIHFPRRNLCYPLYTQGPCQDRYWLIIQGLNVSCSPNTCIDSFDSNTNPEDQVVVPFNNTCYKIGDSCGESGFLISYGDSGYPDCTSPAVKLATGALLTGQGGICPMGNFRFMGSCQLPNEPDFD